MELPIEAVNGHERVLYGRLHGDPERLFCWPSSKETLSRTFGNSPRIFREIWR
jgi:hypothetical protein